jgi:hypothetical protein
MFIPAFWCGVLATLGIAIVALIIAAIVMGRK